jgi:DNA-damage-inducible protein J
VVERERWEAQQRVESAESLRLSSSPQLSPLPARPFGAGWFCTYPERLAQTMDIVSPYFVLGWYIAYVAQLGYNSDMNKSATVRARIDPALKREADVVLSVIGLSPTDAITLFYKQVALRKGMPFEVHIPNALTAKTIRDADKGVGLLPAKSFKDWEKELRALRP